ncbi:hypothetical protein GGR51DRAFT_564515 [Nemania sp. FL0031]|nr:hypothetical protein GGR51DRAFT_564515 [Nemania sp. FL0031]
MASSTLKSQPRSPSSGDSVTSGATLPPRGRFLTANTGTSRRASRRSRHTTTVDPSIPNKESALPSPRTPQPLQINPNDVFNAAFPLQDKEVPELLECEYDSMSAYLVTSEEEASKVRVEIDRLISIVQKTGNTLLFASQESSSLAGLLASEDGYTAMAHTAAKVHQAFRICSIDNDGISLLNAKLNLTAKKFKSALVQLSPDFYISKKPHAPLSNSSTIPATPSNDPCHELVDFLTASMARLMTQIANGDVWHNSVLAVLAKLAAKMKVLLDDVEGNCTVSYGNGEFVLDSYVQTFGYDKEDNDDPDPKGLFREFSKSAAPASFQTHCFEQQKIRSGPNRSIQYLLHCLETPRNDFGMPKTAFEMLNVIIDTGYERFKAHLCQDIDYEFSSTSNLDDLNFSHPAFNMLVESAEYIHGPHGRPPSQDDISLSTKIEWVYTKDGPLRNAEHETSLKSSLKRLELQTMGEIITVMVPLFLASPFIAGTLKELLGMFYLTGDVTDEFRPYPEAPYNVFIRLYTSEFKASNASHVLRLAEAIHRDLFSRDFLLNPHTSREGLVSNMKRLISQKREDPSERLLRLMGEMTEWVYVEAAVVIQCRLYVFITMALAAILLGGGLAIGLTLNTRLKGVNSFNITVYAWALAAFLALVAKSIKLLHDEKESILITRGPYNSVFERRAEKNGDGFSIDIPVRTRTMLVSGLTMLKVETPLGHGLVCLDARRGNGYSIVRHRSAGDKPEELICQDIDRRTQSQSDKTRSRHTTGISLPMKWSKKLEWRRTEGVYSELDAAFV